MRMPTLVGRWTPHSPHRLRQTAGLSGYSRRHESTRQSRGTAHLHVFSSPSAKASTPLVTLAGRHLSWGSSQVAPPPSHTSCPLQRQAALACGHHPANIGASPNTLHVSFRPRSFSLPRRIAPACVRRFVAPCSGHGVRKISSVAAPLGTPHHPKCAQTLQRFPLADSSTASPRPIPS